MFSVYLKFKLSEGNADILNDLLTANTTTLLKDDIHVFVFGELFYIIG